MLHNVPYAIKLVCEICIKNIPLKNYEKWNCLKLFLEKGFSLHEKGTFV